MKRFGLPLHQRQELLYFPCHSLQPQQVRQQHRRNMLPPAKKLKCKELDPSSTSHLSPPLHYRPSACYTSSYSRPVTW